MDFADACASSASVLSRSTKALTCSHRHQTWALFGEELRELDALDLAPLNLAGIRIDDVQLKYGFRQIQPDNG
jgi:hypothetical protein